MIVSNRHRGERGQSTVEFGVAAVVLILLVFGLIDLGRAFYFAVALAGATREGARQASWFDAGTRTNPYLSDAAIQASVDGILSHSGLPPSVLQNPITTCPATSDGNSLFNPPYSSAIYPTTLNQPLLFICYGNSPGTDFASPPSDNSYKGTDVNVIIVMSFGLTSGFLADSVGSSIHLVSNTHMTVGGF
ncbi:MAG TPA: TadE family protein [Candidatus Dormibacteraeota bacterium]|nr:TadE family protein [Candidatus Dormibacteraeota bacterium]